MQEELEAFYRFQYRKMSYSGSGALASAWFHRILERGLDDNSSYDACLEVGCGSGEHLAYIGHAFRTYLQTDLIDYGLGADTNDQAARSDGIRFEVTDA